MKLRKVNYSVLLFLLISITAKAQTGVQNNVSLINTQPGTDVPLDPEVKVGKLQNGFTYYIRKNTEPANRVVIYLVNKVGSVLETDEERGLAHFLEHMAFNGTENFPKHQLLNYLQQAGVRFGADLNAYTSFDETVYQLPIPASDPALMKNAMQIMRDWAQGITLDPVEIDKERGVVLEERRGRLGANQRLSDKLLPVLFNQSHYANRLPIGTEEVLKNFKHETLRKFYETWYRPDLQALIVVGDINVKAVEKMIHAKFSDLKMPTVVKPRTNYTVPLLKKTQFAVITDSETPSTDMEVHFKRTSTAAKVQLFARNRVLQALFLDMINARFSELEQQENMPFTSMTLRINSLPGSIEEMTAGVQPRPGQEASAFKKLWTELERVKIHGFTASEISRARENLLNQMESLYKERNNTPSSTMANEYVQHFMQGEPSPGITYQYNLYKTLVPAITAKDVQDYFESWYQLPDKDILITANEKERQSLPTETVALQWITEAVKENITAYTDKKTENVLMAEKPVAGKIVSEKKLKETQITELVLSNGVRVFLKPTNFKKDEILFAASSPGGSSVVSDKDFHAASMIPLMLNACGVDNFNATTLKKMLAAKKLAISPSIMPLYEGFNGLTSPEDMETLLQLLHLYFTKPRRDAAAFNNSISRLSLEMANGSAVPEIVFQDTIMAVSSGYNFRSRRPTPEELNAITVDKVMQIYKERFADASDFTFVFVGNFDVQKIKPLLEQYLGSLPSLKRKEQWKDTGSEEVLGYVSRKVYKGKEPKARVHLSFGGQLPSSFPNQDQVALFALSEVIQLKLIERLREEESGIYTVQVTPVPRKYPNPRYSIKIAFGCDPANVELLILAVHDEFNKLRKEPVPAEDIGKIRAQGKLALEQAFRSNGYWLSTLVKKIENNNDPDDILVVKKLLRNITAEDIQEAAKRFLDDGNYMRFVLLPEQ